MKYITKCSYENTGRIWCDSACVRQSPLPTARRASIYMYIYSTYNSVKISQNSHSWIFYSVHCVFRSMVHAILWFHHFCSPISKNLDASLGVLLLVNIMIFLTLHQLLMLFLKLNIQTLDADLWPFSGWTYNNWSLLLTELSCGFAPY